MSFAQAVALASAVPLSSLTVARVVPPDPAESTGTRVPVSQGMPAAEIRSQKGATSESRSESLLVWDIAVKSKSNVTEMEHAVVRVADSAVTVSAEVGGGGGEVLGLDGSGTVCDSVRPLPVRSHSNTKKKHRPGPTDIVAVSGRSAAGRAWVW